MSDIHPHADDEEHGNTLVPKVTAMCVLFIASTICGLAPFKLSQWFNWKSTESGQTGKVISSLLNLGGGVLLATTFMHLQPEIMHIIEDLQADEKLPEFKFSLAPLLMIVGFLIIYFIEEVVHIFIERSRKNSDTASNAFTRGIHARESVLLKRKKLSEERNGSISTAELIENDVETQIAERNTTKSNNNEGASNLTNNQIHGHDHNSHTHSHLPVDLTNGGLVANMKGLLIVLALSIHELFEGLAVGLESTESGAWYFFGAVASHKFVIAFCIGVELVNIGTKTGLSIVYVITFAIVSPIGILIGILLSETGNSDAFAVPSVILQGLASGTLLYVIFFEVLSKDRSGFIEYLAVVLGFFVMFGIQLLSK